VPKRFLQNTSERLSAVNNSKLHLLGKTQASILNKGFYLKNFFAVTNDINHTIILETPFIDIITPYKAKHDYIISKINGMQLVFPFLEKSKTRNLNLIEACSIHKYKINALIYGKQLHLHD
jgi:hypothetical protein